jgi:hypothetical protein
MKSLKKYTWGGGLLINKNYDRGGCLLVEKNTLGVGCLYDRCRLTVVRKKYARGLRVP